jgi:heme exporter protein B
MNSLWAVTLATLMKDIRLEWRSKDALNSMLFFSLLVVVIFSFSFDPLAEESRHIAGGLIWVAFLFASVVALNQTWARELRNQVLDAYRVSPAPANALFLAKALGNFIFVSVLEALMTPLFVIFYNLRVLGPAWQLIPIAVLGTWALVVNGTFFAAMSVRTRSREIMLPLLLFPISIPAVLGMVAGTTSILTGEESAHFWIVLLLTYDVVFTTACLALFGMILHAELNDSSPSSRSSLRFCWPTLSIRHWWWRLRTRSRARCTGSFITTCRLRGRRFCCSSLISSLRSNTSQAGSLRR